MPDNAAGQPQNPDSLRQFFGGATLDAFKKNLAEVMTSDEYAGVRKEASERLSTIKWPGAVNKIVEQADGLFDTPVSQALKKVYAESNVLHRYLDKKKYDPAEIVTVEMAQHKIKSKYEPKLDIVINDEALGSVKLEIVLTLELKGVILDIQDARIKAIVPGTCKASGTISYCGKVLAEKKSEPLSLPKIELGRGIPIAP